MTKQEIAGYAFGIMYILYGLGFTAMIILICYALANKNKENDED